MHPLVSDLTELTDAELADKLQALNQRINMSYRMNNGGLTQQLHMILADYQSESQRRLKAQLDEMLEKTGKSIKDIYEIK